MKARIDAIVGRALDLEADARDAYLTSACADDADLLARVRAKLAELGRDDQFLVPPDTVSTRPPDLPEFELLEELGRGGTGIVYRARQRSLGREVAIKLLSHELASEKAGVDRFHREARMMAQIRHPAIAEVYTSGRYEGHHYIAMELVPGHDLETELELQRGQPHGGAVAFLPNPSSEEYRRSCARIIAAIADGLEHAHKQRIVHRDVKPRNVLLQSDGSVKLVDFGMARDESVGRMTRSNVIVGTLCYLSPEQAQAGRAPVDHRTDVYSLGVMLYELLTLTRPFDGPTPLAILRKIESYDPRPVTSVNPDVEDDLSHICATAMHRDVDRRYRSAAALATELRRFLGDRPIRAKRDPHSHVLRDRFVRHRHAIVPAALVAVVMLGVFLALTRVWHQAELARLELTITATDYVNARMEVSRRDGSTDAPGLFDDYGECTTLTIGLPVGYYRFRVSAPGQATLEIARYLDRDDPIRVAIMEVEEPKAPAIRIDADTLTLGDPDFRQFPLHGLSVSTPCFEIDAHPVTNEAFREFCARTRRPEPELLKTIPQGSPDELKPVTMVSFNEAQAYAEWRGRRLPTHAEWLLAARDRDRHTTNEGIPLAIGELDEWTESLSCLPKTSPTRGAWKPDPGRRWVVGGYWSPTGDPSSTLRMSRQGTESNAVAPTRGFRCARSIP